MSYGLPAGSNIRVPLHKTEIKRAGRLQDQQYKALDEQVSRLYITQQLSPANLAGLSSAPDCKAIYVIEVQLKKSGAPNKTLQEAICKIVPLPTLYLLCSPKGDEIQLLLRPHEGAEPLLSRPVRRSVLRLPYTSRQLKEIWPEWCKCLELEAQVLGVEAEIAACERAIKGTKQYAQQVKHNTERIRLKDKLKELKSQQTLGI